MNALTVLDYAGVAIFAATGGLAASRKQLDIIGFVFLAAITGIGGGTLRDLVLGQTPVFWVENPTYLLVCGGVGVAVYFTAHLVESRYRLLLWLDALGLAAFSAMGAALGFAATGAPSVAIVTAMLTATFGGVLRDVLAGEPSVLLRPEIYVAAALAGGVSYVLMVLSGVDTVYAAISAAVVAFAIRAGALRFGWSLPVYKARPGRKPDDSINP